VHSHSSTTPIDISSSLASINTGKNVKSTGHAQINLIADRNYLNLLFPNDYINIYQDIGDGSGWTRLFFGYIDTIEEASQVSENGMPRTSYHLSCSDFQKAIEKTQIYFNPHVAHRRDFDGTHAGTPNIGGLALMSRGIRINGTPGDMIINLVLLLFGFGTQFSLPKAYNPRLQNLLRKRRAEVLLNRLTDDAKQQVLDAGGLSQYLERIRSEVQTTAEVDSAISGDRTSQAVVDRRYETEIMNLLDRPVGADSSFLREQARELRNVLATTETGYPPTLLDVVDVFTFIERTAMDGYIAGAPVWQHQGPVMSFLRSVSNEMVNELFFDLRPLTTGGGLEATGYSRDLDDIEGNAGANGIPNGIQYVPALIMREYPFSTVDRIDGSNIQLSLGNGTTENAGLIYFGAIFSDQPNNPGRHVVYIPNINVEDQALGQATSAAAKHLDVAVLYDQEIYNTRFSRSDAEHFNLFEMYSDAILGNDARFFMQDLLPIITPVHVRQHGLRVRSVSTRFARFSLATVNRQQPQPVEEAPAQTQEPTPNTGQTSLPVDFEPYESSSSTGQGWVSSRWGYRLRREQRAGARLQGRDDLPVPVSTPTWRYHNGVDIAGPVGTPVKAVRDGYVVAVAPDGTNGLTGYGNCVVVYHPNDTIDGRQCFTLYAHLNGFREGLLQGGNRTLRSRVSEELMSGGRYEKVAIRAGEVVGYLGNTGISRGAHLHFEVILTLNNQTLPSRNVSLTPDYLLTPGTGALAGQPVWTSTEAPPRPSESLSRSQDPERIFTTYWGRDLPSRSDTAEDIGAGDGGEDVVEQETPPTTAAQETQDSQPTGNAVPRQVGYVDTPSSRRQLIRWALLQDHWYQHNIEYLNGTIECRPAPEIRVGYRLDLPDRNLSFYVEGVNHTGEINGRSTTAIHVTRGQPTNPHPLYVMPGLDPFDPKEQQRQSDSRLARYFITPDPIAVRRSIVLSRIRGQTQADPVQLMNVIDSPNESGKYDYEETVVEATTVSVRRDVETELETAESPETFGTSTSAMESNPQGSIDDATVAELGSD
jgi:murein DD-endopeptidase MepM/ murein hydrolase activator NlpD